MLLRIHRGHPQTDHRYAYFAWDKRRGSPRRRPLYVAWQCLASTKSNSLAGMTCTPEVPCSNLS
jgi:hypothetical protein